MINNIEAPKEARELFSQSDSYTNNENSIYKERLMQVFPLGDFSTFVAKEQPSLLEKVRSGHLSAEVIVQKHQELLQKISQEDLAVIIQNQTCARVAMLDLSFAMGAAIFSGVTPPDELSQLNVFLSELTGLPEKMTFEKIITINSQLPFVHMRTFTGGDVGETEKRFYYGHELMDVKLRDTTECVTQSVELLQKNRREDIGFVLEKLESGAKNMEEFAEFMRNYMRMPKEHFDVFRQYLGQYPDKTRNASGVFIGIPRLNIRLVGLSPKYEEFLEEGMKYFAINDQPDIQKAQLQARNGEYLVAQCERLQEEGLRTQVAEALIKLIEPIRDFRLSHLSAVYKYVPQAMPEGLKDLKKQLTETEEEPIMEDGLDAVKGTAGFIPGPLLRNIVRLDMQALERLYVLVRS
jgi:hypothetical protein